MNENKPGGIDKEEFARQLMEAGLVSDAYTILGKDAPTPLGLASPETEGWLAKFISLDKNILALKRQTRRWSQVQDPVLIQGESGTGKELIAHALHGNRRGKFIAVNCAGFISNESLMDSELFGHKKGSFTGATETHLGLIKDASDGTLFLDEIGELPLKVQAKLLRVLQDGDYRPVGCTVSDKATCRFVFATHEDIEEHVKEKTFRQDLFFRMTFGRLYISPLRERRQDALEILKKLFSPRVVPENLIQFVQEDSLIGNVRLLQQLSRRWIVEQSDDRV